METPQQPDGEIPCQKLLHERPGHCETDLDEGLEDPQPPSLEETIAPEKRSHYIYYLKIFLDVGYFLLVIPFRLRLNTEQTSGRKLYSLQTNKLQQVINHKNDSNII